MLSLLLTLALAAQPAHAQTAVAYLTPEEVLLQEQYDYYLPPNARRVREIAKQQEADRLEKYSTSSSAGQASSPAPALPEEPEPSWTPAPPEHESAPSEVDPNVAPLNPLDDNTDPDSELDATTLRLINRLQRAQYVPPAESAPAADDQETTNRRENLAGSGPAAAAMLLAVLAAVGITLYRASSRRARANA